MTHDTKGATKQKGKASFKVSRNRCVVFYFLWPVENI